MALSCPSCGAVQAPDARFCNACGSSLQQTCPSCGMEQPATSSFCSACGISLRNTARRATGGDEREERRIVSVLFADLAGSTALGERLDPEDVRELQGELFELVNAEVERFGGVTEKFVGDAVLAVFGIPQAHEDDPERAVRAALAVQEAFPAFAGRIEERHAARVGLRLGVNTGEVVSSREAAARGELMVSGDAVNVAARLQQAAEPGEVLVGERTRYATSRLVEYEERGGIAAKGKRAPVQAWVARRLATKPARRGIEGLSAPIIGRDEELAVLVAVAARVERERVPQLVTLFGQAGVGKSRLLAEFVDRLPGARLLEGRCLPYGDGITYWPLAEVAKAHAGILETDAADVALRKLNAAVGGVVPDEYSADVIEAVAWTIGLALPGSSTAESLPDDIRARLYAAWSRYVAALGREQTTLLAIEDIHWASEPLLDLVDHVVDTLDDTRVLIVCPARPELLEFRPGWGAGKQNAVALNLSPLSPADARRLVSELLDADRVFEEARERILERADGNPFYLEEILRMLIEEGAIEHLDGVWIATERLVDVPIPDSVHGVIAARVDLLDAAARNALRRCSVMGRTFWPAGVDVGEELVEVLARRGLVSERPTSVVAGMREFVFKHALTRDVAYRTLPRPERRELHRKVGEWIENVVSRREGETAELAAYHYMEAIGYGDDDPALATRTFELLVDAGEAAIARAAVSSAGSLLRRALILAPDDRGRCRVLVSLATYEVAELRHEKAIEHLDEARALAVALGDPLVEADVLAWLTRICWLAGRWEDAVVAADDGVKTLAGLPESPHFARALARRSQIEMLRADPDAEPHAIEAIEVGRRVGDVFAEVNGRINLFTAKAARGIGPDAADVWDILDVAVASHNWDEAFRVVVNYIWSAAAYETIPQLGEAVAAAAESLAGVHSIEFESYAKYLALSRARFLWIPSGQWSRIDAELESPGTAATGGRRLLLLEIVTGMAVRRGDLKAADEFLAGFKEEAIASGEPQRIVPMASVVLGRAALQGDVTTTRAVTEAMLMAVSDRAQWAPLASASIPRALLAVGERELLRQVDVALLRGGEMGRYARVVPLASSGLLALAEERPSEAIPPLLEAVGLERERGAVLDAACAELDLALALDATDDAAGAGAARARASVVLEPLGCVNPF